MDGVGVEFSLQLPLSVYIYTGANVQTAKSKRFYVRFPTRIFTLEQSMS